MRIAAPVFLSSAGRKAVTVGLVTLVIHFAFFVGASEGARTALGTDRAVIARNRSRPDWQHERIFCRLDRAKEEEPDEHAEPAGGGVQSPQIKSQISSQAIGSHKGSFLPSENRHRQ